MLRYGENPHQQAALYRDDSAWPGLAQAEQLHGKEMSYNNYTDADAAWRAAFDHEQTCVAIIKHANPCGIAVSSVSVADAHRKAHECDPLSAFGGVIAANTTVSVEMAETVADIFTEVIIAPGLRAGRGRDPGRQEEHPRAGGLRAAGRRHRVPSGQRRPAGAAARRARRRRATTRPTGRWPPARPPIPTTLADLVFAWRTCRAVKSNAIVVAKDGATVGVGMGQVNRVDAARLAVERAGDRVQGAVARLRRVLPVPRRAGDADRRRA